MDGDILPDEVNGKEGAKSPQTDIRVTSRWHSGGSTMLAFHEDRSLFSESGILYSEVASKIGKSNEVPIKLKYWM